MIWKILSLSRLQKIPKLVDSLSEKHALGGNQGCGWTAFCQCLGEMEGENMQTRKRPFEEIRLVSHGSPQPSNFKVGKVFDSPENIYGRDSFLIE